MNDPIKELEARVRATIEALPRKVGDLTVNFAMDNWKRQGFLGYVLQPWPRRKRETKLTEGLPILEGPRRMLRNSVTVLRTEPDMAVVGSYRPYAKAHNEGFRGTVLAVKEHERTIKKTSKTVKVKSHRRNINLPKRQFLGPSPYLDASITRVITAEIMKAAKK